MFPAHPGAKDARRKRALRRIRDNIARIPKDELRMVPLGTLLAIDPSLVPVVSLAMGEGLRRDPDPDSRWQPWRKSERPNDAADDEGRG